MKILEQGDLLLKGIGAPKIPEFYRLAQCMDSHAVLTVRVWLEEDEVKEAAKLTENGQAIMVLDRKQPEKPLFCGILCSTHLWKEKGRPCAELEVYSNSIRMDREWRNCSYQKEQRSREELAARVLSSYQGVYTWDQPGREAPVGGFLMQYQESDWEFLRRLASQSGCAIFPEIRVPGVEVCIGVPENRPVTQLEAVRYRRREQAGGSWRRRAPGGMAPSTEYLLDGRSEDIQIGEPVLFQGRNLIAAQKTSALESGIVHHAYVLRPAQGCRMEEVKNTKLIGAAIPGTVTATTATMSRLSLETDPSEEGNESWHMQPVYYSGGGKGYSGRPEKGDTQYIYFPSMEEGNRYIIGGAGVSFDQMSQITQGIQSGLEKENAMGEKGTPAQAARQTALGPPPAQPGGKAGTGVPVTKESAPGIKSWSTPGSQSASLSGSGLRLAAGMKATLSLSGTGVTLYSRGDINAQANGEELLGGHGKTVFIQAGEYISLKCGTSAAALLPAALHLKAEKLRLEDPRTSEIILPEMDPVEEILLQAEEKKKKFLPIFASDGTVIRREGYGDILKSQEMFDFFMNNYYGKGEYENALNQPPLTLYDSWLTDIYGRTTMQKVDDYIFSLDGLQTILDVAGFVFPPADLVNAVVSLCRGDLVGAGLNALGAIPLVGDTLKGASKIAHGAKTADKVITGLEYTYKAADGMDTLNDSLRATSNALDMVRYGEKGIDAAESGYDGLKAAKGAERVLSGADEAAGMGKGAEHALGGADEAAGIGKGAEITVEPTQYIYRDKEISADVEIKCEVLGDGGNPESALKVDSETPGNVGEAAKKTGADRAAQYSSSWKKGSVKEAIEKFAPDATPVHTDKGKIIFRNESTGIEVVYDKNGNYFRIVDTNLSGKRTALDFDGNKIPNNVTTEKGTQRGMSQGEYNAASHFNNTDVDLN